MTDESLDDIQDFIKEFQRTTGHLPTLLDMFAYSEAKASIALDKDPRGRTYRERPSGD